MHLFQLSVMLVNQVDLEASSPYLHNRAGIVACSLGIVQMLL